MEELKKQNAEVAYEAKKFEANSSEPVVPVRNVYIHDTCGHRTMIPDIQAFTMSCNPSFFSRLLCSHCRDWFPKERFFWTVDNIAIGNMGGIAGVDLRENWLFSW